LMIVQAIIGILPAIATPLYANVQTRARIAKAQADSRTLASAVSIYTAHMGALPTALGLLTAIATNSQNIAAGPFMASIPTPPGTGAGWPAAYAYAQNGTAGTYNIWHFAVTPTPLYSFPTPRASDLKAQADSRTLASAVSIYTAHMGALPTALGLLTAIATNSQNIAEGPFMASIPTPPGTGAGWPAAYAYAENSAAGTYRISAFGDGTSVIVP